jgi:hypothetical protein
MSDRAFWIAGCAGVAFVIVGLGVFAHYEAQDERAKDKARERVEQLDGHHGTLETWRDEQRHVTCYALRANDGVGLSCLRDERPAQ